MYVCNKYDKILYCPISGVIELFKASYMPTTTNDCVIVPNVVYWTSILNLAQSHNHFPFPYNPCTGFTFISGVDLLNLFNWMIPLSILGDSGVHFSRLFHF